MMNEYIDLLTEELVQRKQNNHRYSERAFAKYLGLSPGFLKLLFQRKKQLSLIRAQEIANRLNWSRAKTKSFLESVSSQSRKNKNRLKDKFLLQSENFLEISDWFYFAIVEYLKLKKGQCTDLEIAKAFDLSTAEVRYALRRLEKAMLIHQENDGFRIVENYEVPSISSDGIKKFHHQMQKLSQDAIYQQPIDMRDLRALTLSFDSKKFQQAQIDIQKFVSNFEKKYGGKDPDTIYQLNLSFFQLNKGLL